MTSPLTMFSITFGIDMLNVELKLAKLLLSCKFTDDSLTMGKTAKSNS